RFGLAKVKVKVGVRKARRAVSRRDADRALRERKQGVRYRSRFINITPQIRFSTASLSPRAGGSPVRWGAVAKDRADLPILQLDLSAREPRVPVPLSQVVDSKVLARRGL